MNEKIYTIPQVAEYLQLSKSKVYYLVQRKEIPHIRIGRNVRIRESDLGEWVKEHLRGGADRRSNALTFFQNE